MRGVPEHAALSVQLRYLERTSSFWRERIGGRVGASLRDLPLTTKADLRADQAAHPPFGARLCAPREALVRLHVTSGTTGEPVAIGLTGADHAANSAIGGAAFRIAGVRADDTIAHCLELRPLRGRHRRPHGARGVGRDGRAGRGRPVAATARADPGARDHRDLRDAELPRAPRRARRRGRSRAARRWACATSSPRASRAPASARSAARSRRPGARPSPTASA